MTYEASDEARNATAAATSCGRPKRPGEDAAGQVAILVHEAEG